MLVADAILAVMWATKQGFRWRPVRREEFPDNLSAIVKDGDLPKLDVFICTADPYKEPTMNVVNTALSVMAFDYPAEKISVYVSDDGGSELTLFAFMEAAKFARHWLPFCKDNKIQDRSPEIYFKSNCNACSSELQAMYESMKDMVDGVVERGRVGTDLLATKKERGSFEQWTADFTKQDHPTVIQVILESDQDMDAGGNKLPNMVYISREKRKTTPHHFKAGALNVLVGFRYGSLVEDFFTSYLLACEGWRSVFCNPAHPAFLGDVPINLNDALSQSQRWTVGLLEVVFSKYNPLIFGARLLSAPMAMCYANYSHFPVLVIPITTYALLPPLALLSQMQLFPQVGDPLFYLCVYLFLGAYGHDLLEFVMEKGTFKRWWSDQRMWMVRGVSSYPFAIVEFSLQLMGIHGVGFNVTSKVVDEDQIKHYEQGIFEFGVASPLFVTIGTLALVNLIAFVVGLVVSIRRGRIDQMFLQVLIAGFVVVNGWPVYEAMVLRTDKGKMPLKVTIMSFLFAGALCLVSAIQC